MNSRCKVEPYKYGVSKGERKGTSPVVGNGGERARLPFVCSTDFIIQ